MSKLKQTLLNYQSVFVLGLPNYETYRVFRSLLNSAVQDYMPVSYLGMGSDKTYILFNHPEAIAYIETEQGLVNLSEDSAAFTKADVVYLSVNRGGIPPGFVFIIAPQFKTKHFFADHASNPFQRDERRWLKHFHGILWCDAFPYGEESNRTHLVGMSDWLIAQRCQPNIQLMFFENPSTAESDLSVIGDDLNGCYPPELMKGCMVTVNERTLLTRDFRRRFMHRPSYLENQRAYLQQQIDELEAFVSNRSMFNTTYGFFFEDFLEENLSPSCFDKLFSQQVMRNCVNGKKWHEHASAFSADLVERYCGYLEEAFFDDMTMPFLSHLATLGYTLPLSHLQKIMSEKKAANLKRIQPLGREHSFRHLSQLGPLEFIEAIKNDKKTFTDGVIDFYQNQSETIISHFLSAQLAHLKFIGSR